MFGQSAFAGILASGLVKRGAYVLARSNGASKQEADITSDEYASSACAAATALTAIVTLDPVGAAAGAAYTAVIEEDLRLKREGK